MLRSASVRVLIALVAGLGLGATVAADGSGALKAAAEAIESIGELWLNCLRMTVVPLLFSVLVVGIAGVADAAATGKLAVKALACFAGFVALGCAWALAFNYAFYELWPVSSAGARALVSGALPSGEILSSPPSVGRFLKNLAPTNPIKAAAEDAILPLIVFATFFGFAITRLEEGRRKALTQFFDTIAEAMLVIVRWVLWAAPAGVFALALGVGLRAGLGAAGTIGHYICAVVAAQIGNILLALFVVATIGRVPLMAFLRAVAPVQVTAFATQSSIACLPAMIEQSRDQLKIPDRITGLVLPLAVSVFKLNSTVANLSVAIFVAHVYGIEPSFSQYAAAVLVAASVSVASIGLPGQVTFLMNCGPICLALGLPLNILPILIAVEAIPDLFRTVGAVTGDMAVTAILGRRYIVYRRH
jgi:Na+/H+-dicarboxylate symporter